MNYYIKKPIKVRAIQWTGNNLEEVQALIENEPLEVFLKQIENNPHWEDYQNIVSIGGLTIPTLEGNMKASIGDYIISGVNNEPYPCKQEIFEKTYDMVTNDQ